MGCLRCAPRMPCAPCRFRGLFIDVPEEKRDGAIHKWPFLVSLGIVVVFYLLVFLFVDEYPPYINPADLPPPP